MAEFLLQNKLGQLHINMFLQATAPATSSRLFTMETGIKKLIKVFRIILIHMETNNMMVKHLEIQALSK